MRSYTLILASCFLVTRSVKLGAIFYLTPKETNFSKPFVVRSYKVHGTWKFPLTLPLVVTRYMKMSMYLTTSSHTVNGNLYAPLLERSHKIHGDFHECIVVKRFMEIPVYLYLNVFTGYMEISMNVNTRHMEIYMHLPVLVCS